MGAVTRRTGISEHTLRAWERRFGFPAPHRLESGHRRYPAEQVQHLMLINAALSMGYRAGDVVPLARTELEDLLRDCGALDGESPTGITADVIDATMDACTRFDRDALANALSTDASLLGVRRFLRERATPLLKEIGNAWAQGRIEVRHEHFFSEVLEDILRSLRSGLEPAGQGRPVLLATLPDELHGLGLHIVGLAVAAAGRRVRVLGPHLPVDEIVQAADATDAAAVGLSISLVGLSASTAEAVRELREGLAPTTRVWLGGAGAEHLDGPPPGVEIVASLDDLDVVLGQL
ncbi:MAG: MerR family transcriptional regulator [Thermoanaerobaculales bacterium]|jgi:DNA-binding transcriptional MerR regulator|nr:MerR family transcriptional regulator [Thermoanaerobaculales bacterium]